MKIHRAASVIAALVLTGCVTNAVGPNFAAVAHAPQSGAATVYIFRDKTAYLAQAPHVAKPIVFVDDSPAGHLANGGFLLTDVAPGRHALTIGEPGDTTVMSIEVVPGSSIYLEVWDKTRMQGARIAAGGLVGGAVGGALVGALTGLSGAPSEGRTWHVEQVPPEQAMPVMQALNRSD